MDTIAYFAEIRKLEKELEQEYGRTIFITSVKNNSKNTLPGRTVSALPYNAARCLADETHKIATKEEIRAFLEHQERNRVDNNRSEARKKKEVVVVMDRGSDIAEGTRELVDEALEMATGGSRRKAE